MKPAIIITGAGSGIGRELAKVYADNGHTVFNLSRSAKPCENPNIIAIPCDVTVPKSLQDAMLAISERGYFASQLLCCAGFGISGATEYTDLAEAESQFAVNFFGVFLTIQTFLPQLKQSKHGKIIFIGSVAGEVAIPFQSFYSASKAATNKLLEAWQAELKPFGIQIGSFLLGDTKTDFTLHRQKSQSPQHEYQHRLEQSVRKMERDEQNGISATKTAHIIYRRCKGRKLRPVQTIGLFNHAVLLLQRLLPRSVVLALVSRLYG